MVPTSVRTLTFSGAASPILPVVVDSTPRIIVSALVPRLVAGS